MPNVAHFKAIKDTGITLDSGDPGAMSEEFSFGLPGNTVTSARAALGFMIIPRANETGALNLHLQVTINELTVRSPYHLTLPGRRAILEVVTRKTHELGPFGPTVYQDALQTGDNKIKFELVEIDGDPSPNQGLIKISDVVLWYKRNI